MSDYNFMKSGFEPLEDEDEYIDSSLQELLDYMQVLLALFMKKSTKIGMKYCVLAKRNTLTSKDLEYALKFQAIEFFKNKDMIKELDDIKKELESYEEDEYTDEHEDNEDNEEDTNEIEFVVDDEEPFTEVDVSSLKDYDDIIFVKTLHHYQSYWNTWEPCNYFEKKIKEAIDHIL